MKLRALLLGVVIISLIVSVDAAPPKKKQPVGSLLARKDTSVGSILKNHATYSTQDIKQFPLSSLAFVTPWNNHGYDTAKIFNSKFTYVSPVWFQVKKQDESIIITGQHDIDQNWIAEVRKTRKQYQQPPKIVPRFLFDGWTLTNYKEVLNNPELIQQIARSIAEECQLARFDGVVLDFSFLGMNGLGQGFIQLISSIKSELLGGDLILVVPPQISNSERFTQKEYNALYPVVDQFLIMTYDYGVHKRHDPEGDGSAPIQWITSNVLQIVPPSQRNSQPTKIMIGLNFYGVLFNQRSSDHVLGPQYLRLLEKYQPNIRWNEDVQEHVFTISSLQTTVYYPSLMYIQERLNLAKELNTGVGIWEIGQGLDYFFDLF